MIRPPGPKPRLLFGLLREFYKQPVEFVERTARQYGDIAFVALGSQDVYLLSHPDHIQDVLVTRQNEFKKSPVLERARVVLGDGLLTSERPHHLRQRRLIQPAFHRERLAGYAAVMTEISARYRERWQPGQELDLTVEMARLTLAIVARTLLSANIDSEADQVGVALGQLMQAAELAMLPCSEWIEMLPIPAVKRFRRSRALLDAIIYRLIQERRDAGYREMGDLLSMLLAAQDEDGSRMSDQQVRDEALTLFVAGHETTAVGITWAWYLLSQNPEAESRFHAELDEVLAGRLPGFEDLPRLRYTESVFSETIRLYPPVWGIGRRALHDIELGGYTIPKGCIVAASPWATHRDPRWFPDPLRFQPERWMVEGPVRPRYSYFPFGGGSRACIGERFAIAEGVLVLATLGQRWKFRLKPGHPVATNPLITLRTLHGMHMIAGTRKD